MRGALGAVEQLVLEDQHRVVVAHGALEQALGVVGRGRGDDLQARDVGEEGLQALGMLRAARASRRPARASPSAR